MNLQPGGTGTTHFNVSLQGDLTGVGSPTFTVFRNGVATTVPTTVVSDIVGHYAVSFTVPANWVEYDRVYVRMELDYGAPTTLTVACTKHVGVVTITPQTTEFIADLLVADQLKIDNGDGTYTIQYFQAGTGQTVLLHEQVQTGDPCEGDVSLIATP